MFSLLHKIGSGKLLSKLCALLRHYYFAFSVYLVHDEVKDKMFEMELSWVCEESGGRHQFVPDALYKEAERYAKAALEEDSSDEDEEM